MKVSVDSDRCRGHGVCTGLCPQVFAINDDGYAQVQMSDVPEEFSAAVESAAQACPEQAIETS
ncbi:MULTISPECIES: ferredoxin [unclassified Nocardia]|uniref:ferredoxin n=1 Tax=unclassified Nocardia TaxID=2637762 RepID=UPI00342833FA